MSFIRGILPALRYTLEWIYQFVKFESEEHFLFRQCASALIGLIAVRNSMNIFFERLPVCLSKWFSIASRCMDLEVSDVCLDNELHLVDVNRFQLSQITLLAACLQAIQIPEQFSDFLRNYFAGFLKSNTYAAICDGLA